MNTLMKAAFACVALAAAPVLADSATGHCGQGTEGMQARMKTIHDQMDRIEYTEDRGQQRELMDLHMKHMQEGMRELRKREMPDACRVELMTSMMESMMRHQQLQQEGAK
jgi:hypothetical protein